jgi:hypothetical protein
MEKLPTLHELFEIAKRNAALIFYRDGEVSPIWHAVPAHGPHMLCATPWHDDDEKDIAVSFLRDKFKEYNVVRFVFVVEAWVVQGKHALSGPQPSQHPDRREVLRISAEDRDGSTMSGHYYILRPEHGPATLSEFHEDPKGYAFAGRMSGLLDETRH